MPSKEQIEARMAELAARLGYEYRDLSHLSRAMYCEREPGYDNYTNDAMATLGDAVLKLVWAEYFFDRGDDKDDISRKKSDLENNATLKNLCDLVGAHTFAYNELYFATDAPPHRALPHKDHDFYMEAIIAAIYRDRGLEYVRKFIIDFWHAHSDAVVYVSKKLPQRGEKRRG